MTREKYLAFELQLRHVTVTLRDFVFHLGLVVFAVDVIVDHKTLGFAV